MEPISHLIKVSVPDYLASLPIPNSIGGWFKLGVRDWLSLVPPTALLAGIGFMSYRAFCPHGRCPPPTAINPAIKKDSSKVVDSIDVEDITEKAVFCRCWRSENWPYCDGAHGRHNKEACDNVGPIVITKKK
ncbi:CDGSH iron-sulfur domain-containing protein 2 homolog [Athalia rosae]|uniref:CDGSH iron-sulfur domain-containing protein 2 homolog n=1 Tax=Athalia rosae TaxID=37344 RepID=UPI00062650F0|nr:CDGSH iron-sulfur domain-containing protein 2 homolog [Athalia rosae]